MFIIRIGVLVTKGFLIVVSILWIIFGTDGCAKKPKPRQYAAEKAQGGRGFFSPWGSVVPDNPQQQKIIEDMHIRENELGNKQEDNLHTQAMKVLELQETTIANTFEMDKLHLKFNFNRLLVYMFATMFIGSLFLILFYLTAKKGLKLTETKHSLQYSMVTIDDLEQKQQDWIAEQRKLLQGG
jgi:hypothetical protein